MNRSVVGLGVGLLVVALALIVSPIALNGAESLTMLAEIGVFVIPVAILTLLLGGVAPDPTHTTVGGVFGNPIENEIRARRGPAPVAAGPRVSGSPRQPVNCRQCYTLVGWDLINCPRCARPRECRACGRALEWSADTIVCLKCAHPEVYCNCRPEPHAFAGHRPVGARS